ncbi:hypothetical protein Sjap_022310 [Stephania japonica]|uniref:DUF676 domain-containing protein n=1 Tax=Stephania japonica TaxID=461633 RepID=A0AAP0EUC9_9MAGN
MFRRLRSLIGLSNQGSPNRLLLDAKPPHGGEERGMLEAVQEIAIYIHRFHNLDLFQQGWYQIKITMNWEDDGYTSPGTPARVVQYEAPELGPDENLVVWRIDDVDNSFCTQPFRIKYARQDVPLSIMISFNLSLQRHQVPASSAIILKFELLFAPVLESMSELLGPDSSPAAVHEFRIPPKALLGLHSYCPVHFDMFHAVLVDLTIHITLLKASSYSPPLKVSSDSSTNKDVSRDLCEGNNQVTAQGVYVDTKEISVIKALIDARNALFDELQRLNKVIDKTVDLTDIFSHLNDKGFSPLRQAESSIVNANVSEMLNSGVVTESDRTLQFVSKDDLMNSFHSLGNQISLLWNEFLMLHRANKTKILEFLRDTWASERRAEWSIWMVYSKVEMPHHYLSGFEESRPNSFNGKTSTPKKLSSDLPQAAITRAELHRRSIAQMRINNRSIQDMHIFHDPLHVPVILVERVVNTPLRRGSGNSYFSPMDQKDTSSTPLETDGKAVNNLSGDAKLRSGRMLKIVVFVHGFQGHHLDLRLVRNQWLLIDPGADCLMSEANEERTSGDFREMGLRLAEEVIAFLKKKMEKAARSGGCKSINLSFVGHSIGNVIIRTALTESVMEPFLKYLHTYMSISGPHLGYLYNANPLFNSGLWLLKMLKGVQCIHQLTLTDDPELENTFFYTLCKQKTLERFKNIIVLSSPQDGYIPYHSARIEMCQAALWDSSKKSKVFIDMLNNCLDQIREPSSSQRMFVRCDVNFDTSSHGRNLNTFIGRAAHIEFLETDIFARFIMWSFPDLFR